MARRWNSTRQCVFESLENRWLLAGNVTAQIVKGNLVIKGDSSDNQITITSAGITGVPTTTVNGSALPFAIPAGFAGRVKINMKGGDDTVTVTGPLPVTIKGAVVENTENLTVTGLTVNGNVEVEDVKNLNVNESIINGNVEVEGTDGNDILRIQNTTINGNLEMDGDEGNDQLFLVCQNTDEMIKSLVSDAVQCQVNGKLEMEGGDGTNSFTITNYTVTGKTEVEGGDGIDNVDISGSTFGSLEVETGKGNDVVGFDESTVNGKAEFETGAGNDNVAIRFSDFGSLQVDLGKGDDTLIINNTTVTGKTSLDGGDGSDTLDTTGNNNVFTGGLKKKSFETLIP